MRSRWLIRKDMIGAIGEGIVKRQFNVGDSSIDKWCEDPMESGARPYEHVTDFLLTHPGANPFRREYLLSFSHPAGFTVVKSAELEQVKTDLAQRVEAMLNGVGYFSDELPTDCLGCGAPLIFIPVDGRPEPVCTKRCRR